MASITSSASTMPTIISDGDTLLRGETLSNIGADTTIVFDQSINTMYISAHLKDYKPSEDANGAFTKQFTSILNIVHGNKDKCIVLTMDANTQFETSVHSIQVFSKNNEASRKAFVLDSDVYVSAIISEFPTSNKMRSTHTAQINKSLDPVSATIDHIIVFNGKKVIETKAYVINSAGDLSQITSITSTTAPTSIVDHAFVISTMDDGTSYGTLNIKGGDVEDKAWAEFVPQCYLPFFKDPIVEARLDELLMHTFKDYKNVTLADVKAKNFLSTPRVAIYDINLPNELVPFIAIDGDNINVTVGTDSYVLTKDASDQYVSPLVTSGISEWILVLVNDLNFKEKNGERRTFLLDKGYLLLNYWYNVQNDAVVLAHGRSLASIFDEWFKSSSTKTSIGKMVAMAKALHPNLRVIGIQEMPKDVASARAIIDDIQITAGTYKYSTNIYMTDVVIGSTRGAVIMFD
jgi:hypothetical protein